MSAFEALPSNAALLIIDLQQAIDASYWAAHGPRNNPQAEMRAGELLAVWRARRMPVIHVRHDSTEPGSAYRPGAPGHAFKPEVAPAAGESVVGKSVNSAFVGTDLEARLRGAGIDCLVACGVITNNSVETTVRHGANLGFRIVLAEDACFTFARPDFRGVLRSAEEVHAMSLANLDGEYAEVVTTGEVLAALAPA
jgi:nicotinamidase-related amidase